ncbi:DUF5953 family protein, partial [Corallococcus sp. CA047B]|uniref:DUF5953 family protein n=1 Tax=Corallococcus sp. CA047B TaxID=2316729 RepID=UPI001F26F729
MSKRSSLTLIVYAPSLMGDDGRTLAIIHGMERALPGLRLEWEVVLQLQFEPRSACPVVALHGDGLVVASPATPGQDVREWSHGPT